MAYYSPVHGKNFHLFMSWQLKNMNAPTSTSNLLILWWTLNWVQSIAYLNIALPTPPNQNALQRVEDELAMRLDKGESYFLGMMERALSLAGELNWKKVLGPSGSRQKSLSPPPPMPRSRGLGCGVIGLSSPGRNITSLVQSRLEEVLQLTQV